jgi:hypothetical protein
MLPSILMSWIARWRPWGEGRPKLADTLRFPQDLRVALQVHMQ